MRISPDEPDGVGAARKLVEIALFQGLKMVLSDLQYGRDCGDIFALFDASIPQILPHSFQWDIGIFFAQVQAAAIQRAGLIECEPGDFSHVKFCPILDFWPVLHPPAFPPELFEKS